MAIPVGALRYQRGGTGRPFISLFGASPSEHTPFPHDPFGSISARQFPFFRKARLNPVGLRV
jgi:hypothetical protein